jgi:hypothetical protein
MRKIVRLTERDLTRLVKRIVRETEEMDEIRGRAPYGKPGGSDKFYDADDFEMDDESMMDYSEEKTFGPDNYEDFIDFINGCDTKWCVATKEDYLNNKGGRGKFSKKQFDRYSEKGGFTVRK